MYKKILYTINRPYVSKLYLSKYYNSYKVVIIRSYFDVEIRNNIFDYNKTFNVSKLN